MEPEPTLTTLLEAITALTATVGSLQDQIKSQSQELIQLKAICKETANLLGDKDQGGGQTQPGPSTGPVTPPTQTGGEAHSPATVRPGSRPLSAHQEDRALIRRGGRTQTSPQKGASRHA
ncbi:hypothetical protein RHS01_10278 [Rhizoctonia solani]|uniref:Uncharacterized protein n=1 Tax=Rhizoctonia solani TaxID=456999 RepID=A0A8H7I5M7_9AGAM|nr:hypothetical protein RHS01_10278 [Rhizoctonia solani]